MFLLTKHRGGGVYFKGKTKEGKSVERQGRKAIGPAARNEYGCQLYRLIFITTVRQAEACLFNLKLLNKGNRQQIYLFIRGGKTNEEVIGDSHKYGYDSGNDACWGVCCYDR